MAHIKIKGQQVNIDIRAELEEFDWVSARWQTDKLIAASPFRYERAPSFYAYLEGPNAGIWADSGAYDEEFAKGGIIKLLTYMRGETYEETIDYIFDKYNVSASNENLRIVLPNIMPIKRKAQLSDAIITQDISPYLLKRCISEEVQIEAKTGYGKHKGFTALAWRFPDGRLANVKYRATKGKFFFYEENAVPITSLVYGSELYVGKDVDTLVICEAEIDALSWRTAGFAAVACGSISFTKEKAEIISKINYNRIVAAGDNDKAGSRFNRKIIEGLNNFGDIFIVNRSMAYKDANEALQKYGVGMLVSAISNAEKINAFNLNL